MISRSPLALPYSSLPSGNSVTNVTIWPVMRLRDREAAEVAEWLDSYDPLHQLCKPHKWTWIEVDPE